MTIANPMTATYLTLAEAAHLSGLSEADFAARAPAMGILPLAWLGAILYRRADIEASMDQAWQENISAAHRGTSPGSKARIRMRISPKWLQLAR
jgi:hypothetical protein